MSGGANSGAATKPSAGDSKSAATKTDNKPPNRTMKIVIFGPEKAGKTAFATRLSYGDFPKDGGAAAPAAFKSVHQTMIATTSGSVAVSVHDLVDTRYTPPANDDQQPVTVGILCLDTKELPTQIGGSGPPPEIWKIAGRLLEEKRDLNAGAGGKPPLFYIIGTRSDLVVDSTSVQQRGQALALWLTCWNGPTLYTIPPHSTCSAQTGAAILPDGDMCGGSKPLLKWMVDHVLELENQSSVAAAAAAVANRTKGCVLQ